MFIIKHFKEGVRKSNGDVLRDNTEPFILCTMVTGSNISALIFRADGVKRIFIHFTGIISFAKCHRKIDGKTR